MGITRLPASVAATRRLVAKASMLTVALGLVLGGSTWTVSAASPLPQRNLVVLAQAAETDGLQSIGKLNLNTATSEQFLTIPGVGPMMVREFEEYRPYVSIRQFRREIGKYVPQEQVAHYEAYVFVPVNPNQADAETVQQFPGVDASIAEQIIAGRPYASAEAFLTKLGEFLSVDQLALASTYTIEP